MMNNEGKNISLLVDAWLSDYAIGDLMERTVKLRFDQEKLKMLDAIYISHAHCDHLDPYTLLEIYKYANPILILPFTLRYLEPLFTLYLPETKIQWLGNRETFHLQ